MQMTVADIVDTLFPSGTPPEQMKAQYDPDRRFPGLYEKTVENA